MYIYENYKKKDKMEKKYESRYAAAPGDVKSYDTAKLRKEFLIENLFVADDITLVYSHYDRYIVGGVMPVEKLVVLESIDQLKAGAQRTWGY